MPKPYPLQMHCQVPKDLDKLLAIISMQRGPFTRQHAPDPTIKAVTRARLVSMKQWSGQNRGTWDKFFNLYEHFLWNRAMAYFRKPGVLARDDDGQLTPDARAFMTNFLNSYFTNVFKTGAERYLSGARHHIGEVRADFPRAMNDFWGEVREIGGYEEWERKGGAGLRTKNNLFNSPTWLQRAFETKSTGPNIPFKKRTRFGKAKFSRPAFTSS